VALGCRDDLPSLPVTAVAPDAQDQLGPVAHRDVPPLAVDVEISGDAARGHHQMAAHAVGAEAEVAHRIELSELDRLAGESLRDDRAGHIARVLPRPV